MGNYAREGLMSAALMVRCVSAVRRVSPLRTRCLTGRSAIKICVFYTDASFLVLAYR